MLRIKMSLLTGGLLFLSSLCFGQVITVINESTLQPVEAALVYTADHAYSGLTNSKGEIDITEFDSEQKFVVKHQSFRTKVFQKEELLRNNFQIHLTESVIRLNEITVAVSKWKSNSSDVPNKIITQNALVIDFENPQTSADLLGASGEVFIQKSQLGGGSPMIRGFSANRVLLVFNGIRMNNAIYRSGNLQNVISIDPSIVENVETILGPGTIIYGSDALGGVMNFTTKRAKLSTLDSCEVHANAFVRYSSANNEQSQGANVMFSNSNWASLTGISYSHFGDLRAGRNHPEKYKDFGLRTEYVLSKDGKDSIVPNSDPDLQIGSAYSQFNFYQTFRYQKSEENKWNFILNYSETSDIPRYDRLIQYSGDSLKYAEWYYGPQKWLISSLEYKHEKEHLFFERMKFTLAGQYYQESRNDRKFQNDFLRSRTETVNVYSVNLDFNKPFSQSTEIYYGIEDVMNFVESEAYKLNIVSGDKETTSTRYPDGGTLSNSFALYLSLKSKLKPNLDLYSGLRFNNEYLKSEFDTNPYSFDFSTLRINNHNLNGSLGLSWKLADYTLIKINTGTGYRTPNLDDVSKVFDSEPGNVVVPNPGLKPEYLYSIDFNIHQQFKSKAKFTAGVFYNYLSNAMVRRDFQLNGSDSILYDGEMSKVEAVVNASYAIVYGFSLSVLFDISDHFSLVSLANYANGHDDENLPLRHVAPFFGSTRLIYKQNKLKGEFILNYNGKRSWEDLAPSEQSKAYLYTEDGSPAWTIVSLKGSYQLNKTFQVNAGMENIFDLNYRPYSSGISAPGRNLYVSLKGQF